MDNLYIVMPVYNEEANIKNVITDWYPILDLAGDDSRLIVADGGSTDNTLKILNKLKIQFPKLEVLLYPGTDHGTKVLILYNYAISNEADWIFQTDSDGQTLPEEFKAFWELRKDYDVVIGNRCNRADGLLRKLVENVLRMYLKEYFGVMVPDANAPFRLMRSKVVNKYISLMPKSFNLPNAVFTALFVKCKERVEFRKITFQQRQGGKNHMNFKLIFKIGFQAFGTLSEIRKNYIKYEKQLKEKQFEEEQSHVHSV